MIENARLRSGNGGLSQSHLVPTASVSQSSCSPLLPPQPPSSPSYIQQQSLPTLVLCSKSAGAHPASGAASTGACPLGMGPRFQNLSSRPCVSKHTDMYKAYLTKSAYIVFCWVTTNLNSYKILDMQSQSISTRPQLGPLLLSFCFNCCQEYQSTQMRSGPFSTSSLQTKAIQAPNFELHAACRHN